MSGNAVTPSPCATYTMPGNFAALRAMSEWLHTSARAMGASSDCIHRLDLCANEAITNTISYGYPDSAAHRIVLRLERGPDRIALFIEDDGMPFDPLNTPAHLQPASLDDAPVGGLGIDLIRSLMADCRYERHENLNILSFEVHL